MINDGGTPRTLSKKADIGISPTALMPETKSHQVYKLDGFNF